LTQRLSGFPVGWFEFIIIDWIFVITQQVLTGRGHAL
jgi:hypothetical protein